MSNQPHALKIKALSIIITLLLTIGVTSISPPLNKAHLFSHFSHYKKQETSYPYQHQTELKSSLSFFAGEVTISSIDSKNLFEFSTFYSVDRLRPDIRYSPDPSNELSIEIPFSKKLTGQNYWYLGLNKNVHHHLNIKARIAKQRYNFSSLPLKSLIISTGASQLFLHFYEKNATTMDLMQIDAGASQLNIFGLGYAQAKKVKIHSTAGNYRIDFSGPQTQSSSVEITGAISVVKLMIPKHVNVLINLHKSTKQSVKLSGFKRKTKTTYTSPNFTKSRPILTLSLNLGAGQITIVRV